MLDLCGQPQGAIERECLSGRTLSVVVREFSVSRDSLWCHYKRHLRKPSSGVPASRDQERHELNEKLVSGVRSALVRELNDAVSTGDKRAVASMARELLRSVDASVRLGEAVGGENNGDATAEPCVVIHRDESGEPLEPTAYARWHAFLLPPDRYQRWYERRQLSGAIEVALPWNGRESPVED